ncbi:MAG: hypothetical protein ACJ763_12095 [Bdellovibrionia bacterium]
MSFSESHNLRDENGKPLEVKEGVVIDQNGNELTEEPRAHDSTRGRHQAFRDPFTGGQRVFVMKSTNPLAPLFLAPLLVLLIAVGITLFTGVAFAALVAWMLYLLVRAFRRL